MPQKVETGKMPDENKKVETMYSLRKNFNSFSVISDLMSVNLVLLARKGAVFWKNFTPPPVATVLTNVNSAKY